MNDLKLNELLTCIQINEYMKACIKKMIKASTKNQMDQSFNMLLHLSINCKHHKAIEYAWIKIHSLNMINFIENIQPYTIKSYYKTALKM